MGQWETPFAQTVKRRVQLFTVSPISSFKRALSIVNVYLLSSLFSKPLKIEYVNEKGYNYILRSDSATHQFATDDDCLRFYHEAYQLPLSREEIARAIGYDLILWIGWRNWSNGYDSSKCKILAFWRDGVESGRLRYDDVRLWWRLGLKRWIKTGDVSLLRRTYFLRVKFEKSLFICALKRLVGAFRK